MTERRRAAAKAKRVQQVKRQLFMITVAVIAIVAGIGIYCTKMKQRAEASVSTASEISADADTEKQEIVETSQEEVPTIEIEQTPEKVEIPEKTETPKERLARVKKEAIQAEYPEGVIELLSKNKETVEYVENYAEKKDSKPAKTIAELKKGEIPQLLQWDERWGYFSYGTSNIAVCGCGPTCLSMVFSALTGDFSITPDKLAVYGMEHDYINEENDTRWAFMTEAGDDWGIKCREEILDEKSLFKEIEKGHPVVCSVGPGPFTDKGHFIVLAGIEDGKLIVNDPFSIKNSTRRWEYKEFEDQIKTMWIYSKKK